MVDMIKMHVPQSALLIASELIDVVGATDRLQGINHRGSPG